MAKGAWLGLPRSLSYLIDGSNKNDSTNNENECNSGNACLGGNNDGGNYDSNLRMKRVEKNEAEFNELPLKPPVFLFGSILPSSGTDERNCRDLPHGLFLFRWFFSLFSAFSLYFGSHQPVLA